MFDEGSLMNGTYRDLDALVTDVDVLMLLRIQHERHDEKMKLTPQDYLKKYRSEERRVGKECRL